jgi:Alpha-L-fucosidase/F5/8 type C domain
MRLFVRLRAIAPRFNVIVSLCKQRKIIKISIAILSSLLVMLIIILGTKDLLAAKYKTDWLSNAKWGIMTHYLTSTNTSAEDWNNSVNNFDVKKISKQLKSVGAKYYMISIGQNSGHYCAPNSTYDRYTNIRPSKCSSRDLVSDLYEALNPMGIKLMVYLPAGAPAQDRVAVSKLGWINGADRNQSFQVKWESVIREWSLRWGKKVKGWWFDGVQWPNEMYGYSQPPNFYSFAAAARAGNPDSIIAFNPGPKYPLTSLSNHEDYTAGEIFDPRGINCESRWVKNSQFHILSYLGSDWGSGLNRYKDKEVIDITRTINKCGGVITWDVPIKSNGSIPQPFINQLIALRSGLKRKPQTLDSLSIPPGNIASNKKARLLNLSGEKDLPVNGTKHFPGLGVDGDPKTFALAGGAWSWIYQVDLAKIYQTNRISVTFGPTFATEYKVISSENGVHWSILKHEKNARDGKYTYKIAPTKMRYIRVQGIKPNAPNQPGIQMSIAELEAYQK